MRKQRVVRHEVVQPRNKSIRYIPLTQGQNAIVDASDYEWLMQRHWHARWDSKGKRFYATTNKVNRQGVYRKLQMHMAVLQHHGVKGIKMPDHANRNGLDNRFSNLRKCTPHQNQANTKIRSDNTTGYRGVKHRNYNRKRWSAAIQVRNKAIFLGHFYTAEEAAKAYDIGALRYLGEFATLNFPRQRARP